MGLSNTPPGSNFITGSVATGRPQPVGVGVGPISLAAEKGHTYCLILLTRQRPVAAEPVIRSMTFLCTDSAFRSRKNEGPFCCYAKAQRAT